LLRSNDYFRMAPMSDLGLVAALANMTVAAISAVVVVVIVKSFGNRWVYTLAQLFFLIVCIVPLNHLRVRLGIPLGQISSATTWIQLLAGVGGLIVVGLIVFRWQLVVSTAKILLLITAPFVFFIVVQSVWYLGADISGDFQDGPFDTALAPSDSKVRILWLIFDQLDFVDSIDERPKDLLMPSLDAFRATAFDATNTYAPSGWTITSFPAFLTGRLVTHAKPADASTLLIRYDGESEFVSWSEEPNLFDELRKRGINSEIIGTYHPYCRVMTRALKGCAWRAYKEESKTSCMSVSCTQKDQLLKVLTTVPGVDLIRWFQTARRFQEQTESMVSAQTFAVMYQDLRRQVETRLSATNSGLLFVHMPIPHPPYIRHLIDEPMAPISLDGYAGNLQLMDAALGSIRKIMVDTGQWDSTVVIVSSDHGSKSDKVGGSPRVARRIPFLVKMPGQNYRVETPQEFNSILTYRLILSVVDGTVTSPESLKQWVETNAEYGPSPTFPGNIVED
ncbi:MAG: sulfatase-like hydrolase/transferase, partial [Pseudomonadales bacterium]